jgi:nucleoside 2-deoxyribosyltransferase
LSSSARIAVVGGVYREQCVTPHSDEVFGSAGRAALALAALGAPATLHGYFDSETLEVMEYHRSGRDELAITPTMIDRAGRFVYRHWLATPKIHMPTPVPCVLEVNADNVLRYGMLEGEAVVHAKRAVFDPQNTRAPKRFFENGSTADELALVLNEGQARSLVGDGAPSTLARRLLDRGEAKVVVIKRGPSGALVAWADQEHRVPAYWTNSVWKIGSGDHFAAHFAYQWLHNNESPEKAADFASRATATYCDSRGYLHDEATLFATERKPIAVSARVVDGYRPKIYLAGPFFTLAQRWLVDEARDQLRGMGMDVFSPVHDVGDVGEHADERGTIDTATRDLQGIETSEALFVIADGFDAGTVFEAGYARARQKPVVVYAENEKKRHFTMFDGSHCDRCGDFVTAIYHTVWSAIAL